MPTKLLIVCLRNQCVLTPCPLWQVPLTATDMFLNSRCAVHSSSSSAALIRSASLPSLQMIIISPAIRDIPHLLLTKTQEFYLRNYYVNNRIYPTDGFCMLN